MASLDPRAALRRAARSGRGARDRALQALARLVYREPVSPPGRLSLWLSYAARMAEPELLGEVVRANLAAHGPAVLGPAASAAMARLGGARARRALFTTAWGALRESDAGQALAFGDGFIDAVDHPRIAVTMARLMSERGALARPLELARRHPAAAPELLPQLEQQAQLLRDGYPLPAPSARAHLRDRRVLYVLAQSVPHHTSGYAIRSHWMLRHLVARGWDISGATRFGYPADRPEQAGRPDAPPELEVDGVTYRFRPDPIGHRAPPVEYLGRAAAALESAARAVRPSIIHAASNHEVGLPAIAAARALGVPAVYEVRGLWHLSRSSREPAWAGSEHYRMLERLEVDTARAADHVLVITGAVLDFLAERGVDRAKMSLLPNAVDPIEFAPRARDHRLSVQLGVLDRPVIGTVGTFKWYEGLELLLEAVAALRRELGDGFRVLLVGDGPETARLTAARARLGLEDLVIMPGRVPHDQVARYYSLIDVAAYPRLPVPVCQLVSPLKPLEAMAMEKAVVVSDVKAQLEMVEDGVTGLVHPAGDAAALARALARLVAVPSLRAELARRARAWAAGRRSWPAAAATVTDVYDRLLS